MSLLITKFIITILLLTIFITSLEFRTKIVNFLWKSFQLLYVLNFSKFHFFFRTTMEDCRKTCNKLSNNNLLKQQTQQMSLYYPKGPISVGVRNSSLQTGEICRSIVKKRLLRATFLQLTTNCTDNSVSIFFVFCHDIPDILLKVALNTITLTLSILY